MTRRCKSDLSARDGSDTASLGAWPDGMPAAQLGPHRNGKPPILN